MTGARLSLLGARAVLRHAILAIEPVAEGIRSFPSSAPKCNSGGLALSRNMPDRSEIIFRYVAFGIGAGVVTAALIYVFFYR